MGYNKICKWGMWSVSSKGVKQQSSVETYKTYHKSFLTPIKYVLTKKIINRQKVDMQEVKNADLIYIWGSQSQEILVYPILWNWIIHIVHLIIILIIFIKITVRLNQIWKKLINSIFIRSFKIIQWAFWQRIWIKKLCNISLYEWEL